MNKYGIRPITDDNDEAFKLIERERIALGIDAAPNHILDVDPDQNGGPNRCIAVCQSVAHVEAPSVFQWVLSVLR